MPVHHGRDSAGPYFQYGSSGKKYYYQQGSESSKKRAKKKAHKQGRAIQASGYNG